jgi:PhnB protein
MAVQPVPEGYEPLSPYLAVDDAKTAIDFYQRAFGAKEVGRIDGPDGTIAHADLQVGDGHLMLADPFPQFATRPPKELGGTSVSIFMYVEDVDAAFKQAVDAGATAEMEPDDMFWGDRFGSLRDPFGHSWQLATHIEDVPQEEMTKRAEEFAAQMAAMASS